MRSLLVAAFVVSACAATVAPQAPSADGCRRVFKVEADFTVEEKEALISSVRRWNEIAFEQFCIRAAEPSDDSNNRVFRIAYRGPLWQKISEDHGGDDIYGVHYSGSDRIGIVDVLGPDLFELVALHEFGHAHGLTHTPAPSIMHASISTARNFTSFDIAECRRVGACVGESDGGN